MTKQYDPAFVATTKQPARRHVMLYHVTTQAGFQFFFCDADTNLNVVTPKSSGKQLFQAFGHDRQQAKTNATLQVDQMDVGFPKAPVMYAGREQDLGAIALNGVFDRATVYLFKWDQDNPDLVAQWHSQWLVQQITVTRTDVSFRMEAALSILVRHTPRTLFQPECNNSLFDVQCSLLEANFTTTFTCVSPSDQNVLYFTGTPLTGFYDLGRVKATSGLNIGLRRSIRLSTNNAGTLQILLSVPFPAVPVAGVDTFTIIPGCDKLITTCQFKFNNLYGQGAGGGFRGYDRIPRPFSTL